METLKAAKRGTEIKPAALRASGSIPSIYYGRKEKAMPVTVVARDFEKVFKSAGESSIITLSVDGDEHQALIHEIQRDPVTEAPVHVDFYAIERDRKLQVSVPLEFEGVAPAVKELGGMVVKVLHELEIEALPKDLPHDITVDISGLVDFDAQIHVRDLALPEGVVAVTDADEVVVLAAPAAEEEEETPAEAPDLESIEVEKKGKSDEEAEGGGADKADEG